MRPSADELVPVAIRAERRLRVVHVQDTDAVEADAGVEILERRVERGGIRHVDTGSPPVTGVEAEAEPRVVIDCVRQGRELRDRAADRAAGARSVLHAEPEIVCRQLEELAERRLDERDCIVEADTEVRAHMEDHRLRADRVGRLHGRA